MSEEKMRDEFDSWIEQQGMNTMKDGETYYHHATHAAWQAWKASRAAPDVQVEPAAYMFADDWGRTKIVLGKETAELWTPPGETIKPLYTAPQLAEHQPECGCCGQTSRCDDDCDAVVIGGHRAAEQKPVLTEALRQYRNNDGSGLVFGYDKLLVDQYVTQLVEALECALETMENVDGANDCSRGIDAVEEALAAYRKQGGDL